MTAGDRPLRPVRKVSCILLGLSAFCVLFVSALPLWGQRSARYDVSPFGMIGVARGETLSLEATAKPNGLGCRAQLGFNTTLGVTAARSLNVNLAPGRSASVDYVARTTPEERVAVRPVVWVESRMGRGDCDLSVFVKDATGKVARKVPAVLNCDQQRCSGVPTAELTSSKLRLYVVAGDDNVCHAEMGFRLSRGKTSATSRYVTLMPNHAESLDWRLGDEDFSSTDSVIPVVAFHKDDTCLASSEVFDAKNEPATRLVPVQSYESRVIGLAMDPASIGATIHELQTELRTNPNDLWTINALGQAYDSRGERLQAINLMSHAVEVNPRASESWLLLAKFQYEKLDYTSSIESLEKCLALDPANVIARAAYADSLAKVRRLDEADKHFAILLKDRDSRTPAVLTAYADYLYVKGSLPEALEHVTEADVRRPNCERTLIVKAQILKALKRLPEATQAAEWAVQIDSNFRLARLLLAELYALQGKTREAADQEAWLRANVGKSF